MIYLLPAPRESVLKRLLGSKKFRYKIAACIDLILIFLILINGRQPAQRMISPLVSSLHDSFYSITQHRTTQESFAFVPGLARNKFEDIDLEGLSSLSFFDVPLTEDGQINLNSRGYASFTSDEASKLFDRARYNKTKIFLTLSAWDESIIQNVLSNKDVQERLANQAIEQIKNNNIDGITIDFEYPQGAGRDYQQRFTNFISLITTRVHNQLPQAQVAVGMPSNLTNNQSLYNTEDLSRSVDKVFLIASDFIVPEVKNNHPTNPVYGFSEEIYWKSISNLLENILNRVTLNKLVMERAWYGNGDKYPLYTPNNHPIAESKQPSSSISLDKNTIENLVAGVPQKGKAAARRNIPLIAKALDEEGILDSNVLAYALATVEHETDETFEALGEIQGGLSARRFGYEGGMNYFGRGFIQLTHLRNYKAVGERIGMGDQLVRNPQLASSPEVAAKVLAAFFKDNNVANLASQGYFVAARKPVNPDYNGYSVARLAMKYEVN